MSKEQVSRCTLDHGWDGQIQGWSGDTAGDLGDSWYDWNALPVLPAHNQFLTTTIGHMQVISTELFQHVLCTSA